MSDLRAVYEAWLRTAQAHLADAEWRLEQNPRDSWAINDRYGYKARVEGLEVAIINLRRQATAAEQIAAIRQDMYEPTPIAPGLTLQLTDAAELEWAQAIIAREHYLHAPVDPRSSPLCYLVWHGDDDPFAAGILMFGRPEATRCYTGGLTYGSAGDVLAGRAQLDRWELLNLARVWVHPKFQAGGFYHRPGRLPGYTDRRGVWRSTLASTAICAALVRVGYDYLRARPPVDCEYPYQIRAVLSYCDTRVHKGTIYRASGFQLARTNEAGIETWWTSAVAPLSAEQDGAIRRLSELDGRAQRIRAQRAQLELEL